MVLASRATCGDFTVMLLKTHFWEECYGHTSNDAVEVKWILLTISSNAERTGSYKECRLAPVEISERLDGGLEDGCRWGLFWFLFYGMGMYH